jgi:hypothetical protein
MKYATTITLIMDTKNRDEASNLVMDIMSKAITDTAFNKNHLIQWSFVKFGDQYLYPTPHYGGTINE